METKKLVQSDLFCTECREYHYMPSDGGPLTGRCMARELSTPADPLSWQQRALIAVLIVAIALCTIGLFAAVTAMSQKKTTGNAKYIDAPR